MQRPKCRAPGIYFLGTVYLPVRVCIHTYLYLYICLYIYIYIHIHIHIYIHIYIHIHIYIYIYVCVCVYLHGYVLWCVCVCVCVCMDTCCGMCVCVRAQLDRKLNRLVSMYGGYLRCPSMTTPNEITFASTADQWLTRTGDQ